jgi:hypothetical protein
MANTFIARGKDKIHTATTPIVNMDNGAGATIDITVLRPTYKIKIKAARIVYDTETAGTVAAATAQLGTTVGGAEIVAATAYTNSKTVGATTAMTLVLSVIPANTPIIFRHTGIATTAAGEAHIELDYQALDR